MSLNMFYKFFICLEVILLETKIFLNQTYKVPFR